MKTSLNFVANEVNNLKQNLGQIGEEDRRLGEKDKTKQCRVLEHSRRCRGGFYM